MLRKSVLPAPRGKMSFLASWFLGHAPTNFTHPDSGIVLPTKEGSKESLADFCKRTVPPCRLNPLLFNGHLQTTATVLARQDVPIYYKRKIFEADKPQFAGTYVVDFATEPYDAKDDSLPPRTTFFSDEELTNIGSLDSKPMLVALHGLSGGSYELYLRHVLAPLISNGWEACVVTSRGCANSKITTGILYNARATWDLRQTVNWLREKFPNRPLFGIGFSLGANIMTNYLGEEGSNSQLKAVVVCSNPWNLDVSSVFMQRSLIGMHVYSRAMGTNMKKLLFSHEDVLKKHANINWDDAHKIVFLHELDRVVQVPTWGYPTESAYYRDASSTDSLLAVRTPLLAINAEDDPIAVKDAIPFPEFKQNPYTVLCTTPTGGHLGWFELTGGRWFARAAVAFLSKAAEEIDFNKFKNSSSSANGAGPTLKNGGVFEPMRRRLYNPDM